MPNKHYADVQMIKTTDLEGRLVIDSKSVQTTFDKDGTLTFNENNGVLTWNSGDITHCNFTSDDFMIMFDAESCILTLTTGDKNIYYNLEDLKKMINEKGLTLEEMNKILYEKETNENAENKED